MLDEEVKSLYQKFLEENGLSEGEAGDFSILPQTMSRAQKVNMMQQATK